MPENFFMDMPFSWAVSLSVNNRPAGHLYGFFFLKQTDISADNARPWIGNGINLLLC